MFESVKHCVRSGLQQLARRAEPLHHFSRQGRQQRHFRRRRVVHQIFRIGDAQDADGLLAGLQIGLRLRAVRFGLLEIGLGDGLVRVEVLRALVKLVRELKGVARFDVGRAQQRIVGAGDVEHRLARAHLLARRDHDAAYRASHLRDHRRGLEGVVGDRAGEPQSARQRRLRDRVDLDVRHLVGRQRE